MLRLYRQPQKGEFFVVFGDCAQGGSDSNFVQFLSKSRIDVPLVYQLNDVAAAMTPILHQTLEWLFDKTGVQPIVGLERNNGGASEMRRLIDLNRQQKYRIYYMRKPDGSKDMNTPGWNTDVVSRPRMVGDWKEAFKTNQVRIYDEETLLQHQTFITNRSNKPEAAPNAHDDAVMSLAGAWQLYQTEDPIRLDDDDDYDDTSGNITSLWG